MSMSIKLEAVQSIQRVGEVAFDHGEMDGIMRYFGKPIDAEKVIQLAAEKGLTVYKRCHYAHFAQVGHSYDVQKTTLTTTKFESAFDAMLKSACEDSKNK